MWISKLHISINLTKTSLKKDTLNINFYGNSFAVSKNCLIFALAFAGASLQAVGSAFLLCPTSTTYLEGCSSG